MNEKGRSSGQARPTRRQMLRATAVALAGSTVAPSAATEAIGSTLYIGSRDNRLYAVSTDIESGEVAWTHGTGGNVYSSPTVVEGTVYVGSHDGTLYAVDAVTGEQIWGFDNPSVGVQSSPTVVDGTVYVGAGTNLSDDGALYAVNAATGDQEWAFTQPSENVDSSPTVIDGTVYVGSKDNNVYALDAETGEEDWYFDAGRLVRSSPTVVDGTVYVGSYDGRLYAINAETGVEEWAFVNPSRSIRSSPTLVGGVVYAGSRDGTLYAVDAVTGEEVWAFDQPSGPVHSSPTAADGTVYVGSDDETLYAVDAESGETEWTFTEPSERIRVSPTVANGTVYFGSDDGRVYAVDTDTRETAFIFEEQSGIVRSSPTVVANPETGDSTGSRVVLGTLGHHGDRAERVTLPSFFEVRVEEVTEPPTGDDLEVTVVVENTGETQGEKDISLIVDGLGNDSSTLLLESGGVAEKTLSVPTDEGETGTYTATIESEDDSVQQEVTVLEAASLAVTIEEVTATAEGGTLEVTAEVTNTGAVEGTQTIGLDVAGLGSSEKELTLSGGESKAVILRLQTDDGDAGEYTATVATDDDTAQQGVEIIDPVFLVDITEVDSPVADSTLDVTARIENTATVADSQTLDLVVPGFENVSTTLSLAGGESTTESFAVEPTANESGERDVTVASDDDSATETVLIPPPSFDVSVTAEPEVPAGEQLLLNISVTNTGGVQGTETVEYRVDELGNGSVTVTLAPGESTTESIPLGTSRDTLGNHTISITTDNYSENETVSVEGAGFGFGGALAALAGTAYLLKHRMTGESEHER